MKSFQELAAFRRQRAFAFDLCLENLPFPNLGATPAEYARIHGTLAASFPLRMTLDVPHFFVSRNILLRHPNLRPFVEGYPAPGLPFYDELADWLAEAPRPVRYYHIYGAVGEREHLPIDDRHPANADELDLRRVLGDGKPLIVEVFGHPLAAMLDSARNLERMLRGR